jgi:tetratricopeptide (TPR) repeat protein/photosystem II stability/assembly factor-like uncharacterized protein
MGESPHSSRVSKQSHSATTDQRRAAKASMAERVNPYIAGAPVTDPAMFFGREDVFSWIEQNIAGRYASNTLVIHGQRRVGKTSVLKQLHLRLPERFVPVFFDLQGRTHATIDRFLWRLAREIVRTVRTRFEAELGRPEQEPFSRDPEYFVHGFMDEVRQAIGGDRSVVVVFDEFDTLEEPTAKEMLGQDLIPFFSRILQTAENVSFVFSIGSSGHKLEHMQAGYTDFFRSALYKKISFLEPDQTKRLITEPAKGVAEYDRRAVKRIQALASGHPYFTQLICHELFARCQKTDLWQVDERSVEAVLPDVVERGTVNLKSVWDEASDEERYTLAALASLGKPAKRGEVVRRLQDHKVRISEEEVGTALRTLAVKDVLADDNTFTVDLVRLWLAQNKPIERVIEELIEQHPIAANFVHIAEEYRDRGMPDRALQSYHSALETAPDYKPAHLGMAEIHEEAERWEEAAAAYQAVLELDDEHIRARAGVSVALLALGDAARQAGDVPAARQRYEQILALHDGHVEARERMAEIHLARARELEGRKDWDGALEELAQAAGYTPGALAVEELDGAVRKSAAAALTGQAVALRSRKRFDEAISLLEQALHYTPDSDQLAKEMEATRLPAAEQLVSRAAALREKKRFPEAIDALERAERYYPDLPQIAQEITATREAERAEGMMKMLASADKAARAERWAEAIATYERYLELEPDNAEVVAEVRGKIERVQQRQRLSDAYAAGREALDRKDYSKARSFFKEVINEEVGYRDATELLARAVELQQERTRSRRRLLVAAGIAAAFVAVVVVGWWLAQPQSPLMIALAGPTPTPTCTPTPSPTATPTPLPTASPTPVAVNWRRLSSALFLPRDTVTAIAADLLDPNVLYIGTENAGVYKSINAGTSWLPASPGLQSGWVSVLETHPQSPDTLFITVSHGEGEPGAFYSTDGAASWQPLSIERYPSVYVDPYASSVYMINTSSLGMEYSKDEGETWALCSSSCPEGVWPLTFHPIDSSILMAAPFGSHNGCSAGVYLSTDGGESWSLSSLELPYFRNQSLFIGIDPQGDTYLLAIATPGGTFRSSDMGATWAELQPQGCNCRYVTPGGDGNPIMHCCDDRLLTSHDGGHEWYTLGLLDMAGEQTRSMLVSPHNPDIVYVGAQGLSASTDGGASWSWRNNGLPGTITALLLSASDTSTLYAEGRTIYTEEHNRDLHRSSDGGRTWEFVTHTGLGLAIDADGETMYRGGDSIWRSRDGGTTWTEIGPMSGGGDGRVAAHPSSTGVVYSTFDQASSIYLSSDGGETWPASSTLPSAHLGDDLVLFFAQDAGGRMYGRSRDRLLRSENGGESWSACSFIPYQNIVSETSVAIHPHDSDTLFLATRRQGLLHSDDGCATWAEANVGLDSLVVNTLAFDPTDPETAYCGTDGGAYVSFDGGEHWSPINEGLLGGQVVYSIVVDREGTVYAATPLGIFTLEGD